MNILFIGVYRDFSGWSKASESYILSLDAVGANITPRCCRFNYNNKFNNKRILELEKKLYNNYDVCIQQTLPIYMEYCGQFQKNIGVFCTEGSSYQNSQWVEKLNLMDELWVSSEQIKSAAQISGVNKEIKVLPYALDIEKISKKHKKLDMIPNNTFNFYTIGAINRRKNLAALIKAFHSEFSPEEPVSLIIKASQNGMNENECAQKLWEYCRGIKTGLNLYSNIDSYKEEILITKDLNEDEIYSLHSSCDCGVFPSYAEAWCYPALESMAFGKTPICTGWSGFTEFINSDVGSLCNYQLTPIFGMDNMSADIYKGRDYWADIDILDLKRCMRIMYEDESVRKEKSLAGIDKSYDFSYQNVGLKLLEAIKNVQKISSKNTKSIK